LAVNGDDVNDVGDGGGAFDGHIFCSVDGWVFPYRENKVQVFAADVKKNLALFITFFWKGKRVL
jgi:hypothetical protein